MQGERCPVNAACVEDAAGDDPYDVADMRCTEFLQLLIAEYADIASASICGQQYVTFSSRRRASRLTWVTAAEPRAVAGDL